MTHLELDQPSPLSTLDQIAALAHAADAPALVEEAEALAHRLAEGRFYVVCLGQFKRGKSTLINALVGRAVLPMGVAPVTSVATILRFGTQARARVRQAGALWTDIGLQSLAEYVAEDRNPGNAKGVTAVEVFLPSHLLEHGLCLVDTPGIGSVFAENTAATRGFLPQVDAALMVLGGDPPITGEELALIEEVAGRVGHRLFVFAKADRLPDAERSEAFAFTKNVLARRLQPQRGTPPAIWEVCATEVLSSGRDTRDWPLLVRALEHLAGQAGANLVAAAERRGSAELVQRLLAGIDARIAVLETPLEESERRLARLDRAVDHAVVALRDVAPLFAAEEARISRVVEADRDEWLRAQTPLARQALQAILSELPEQGPRFRTRALSEASEVARRCLADWRVEEGPKLDRLFRSAMQRFLELLAGVEEALVSGVGPDAPRALPPEPGIRAPSQFYLTEMLATAPLSPARHILDAVCGHSERRRAAIGRDALGYLERLLEVNSARLKNDFRDRLASSRRQLETAVAHRLTELTRSSEDALDRARALQRAGADRVEAELTRLRELRLRAQALTGDESAAG